MFSFIIDLTLFNVIMVIVSAILGALLFVCSVFVLNRVPAPWLCDYDEEPSEEMLSGKRFKGASLYVTGSVLSAAAFALIYLVYGFTIYTPILMVLSFVLTMIILSDCKYYIIPDQFAILSAVFSLMFAYYDFFNGKYIIKSWWSPLVGGISVAALIIIVNLLTILIAKKDGMGFGDVKLFAGIGIATGFPQVGIALLIAVLIAFLIIILTVIVNTLRKKETENYIPFGPSICIGVYLVVVLHQPIAYLISLYFSLFI
ncbi:MAG: A24 family peptidase [Acutalibacteraceae bacterium]|nr:A24 family peptidase [Acutalibacteraceae bacterium]